MPKVLSWKKNGLIQNYRYFSKITVPVRTGTIVIVPVRSLSLRTVLMLFTQIREVVFLLNLCQSQTHIRYTRVR